MSADGTHGGSHDEVSGGEESDARPWAPESPPEPSFSVKPRPAGDVWSSSAEAGSQKEWNHWEPDDREVYGGARETTTRQEWSGSTWGRWESGDGHSRGSGWDNGVRRGDEHSSWARRASWDATTTTGLGSIGENPWPPRDDPWTNGPDPWSKGWKDESVFRARQDDWGVLQGGPQADGRAPQERGDDRERKDGGWSNGNKQDRENAAWNGWSHFGGGGFQAQHGRPSGPQSSGRASEKLNVPSFTGDDVDDVGGSARSYLRQVEAWRRMTTLPCTQQGLVLYQHLGGKAWIAAEELSLQRLGSHDGVGYLVSWINARGNKDKRSESITPNMIDYMPGSEKWGVRFLKNVRLGYTLIACPLTNRKNSISSRALETAITFTVYSKLQCFTTAARGSHGSIPVEGRLTRQAHVTENAAGDLSDDDGSDLEDGVPEDVAVAYATYQSAKERYKEQTKSRGYHGDKAGDKSRPKTTDAGREEKIKLMKSKSFCNSCGKKGHWHKDPECPNNKQSIRDIEVCHHVPAEVFSLRHDGQSLVGITDTACAKSVAGTAWLQNYANLIEGVYQKPELIKEAESFRFGTGRVHHSSFHVILYFSLGSKVVELQTSIINGDVPLLLSKPALAQLGMVYDVAANRADFGAVGLKSFGLITTSSGHPAIPIVPARPGDLATRLAINDKGASGSEQYMAFAVSTASVSLHKAPKIPTTSTASLNIGDAGCNRSSQGPHYRIFYDKSGKPLEITVDRWKDAASAASNLLRQDMSSAACKPPPINSMSKTQLLEECNRVGLVVHRTWTVEELKAVIQEHRMQTASQTPSHQMKSVTSLNLPEMKAKAVEMGIDFPSNITKGNLLRLIRDSLATPGSELMKIGKYKGFEFQEIPNAYGEWASKEVKTSANPHVELVRFARWWDNEQTAKYTTEIEQCATVPFTEPDTDGSSAWGLISDWGADKVKTPSPSKGSGGYPMAPRPNKRGSSSSGTGEMDTELDQATLEEIRALETRLATLKQKAKAGSRTSYLTANHEVREYMLVHFAVIFPTNVIPETSSPPQQLRSDGGFVQEYEHEGNQFGSKTLVQNDKCCGQDKYAECHDGFITAAEFSLGLANKSTNYACEAGVGDNNDSFQKALDDKDFTYDKLKQLLDGAGLKKVKTERGEVIGGTGTMANYHTVGLYTHGGTYGITTCTKDKLSMTKYINQFGRHHLGQGCTWTSVTIAYNTETAIHHDFHNLHGSRNYVTSFGQTRGGGLWIENKDIAEDDANKPGVQWRKDKTGKWIPGKVVDTRGNFATFDPFLKHATEPWRGDRWCLVFHSTRNYVKIENDLHGYLKKCGFPLPRRAGQSATEGSKPKKPGASMRKSIFNNAAKVSILMTTFLAAANSFLAATAENEVMNQPIVVFEIGGTTCTEEAVALGKDVFEPMDWSAYESPEGKEMAYHVVNGGSPKELRLNLDGKKSSCDAALVDLIEQQVFEGGTVVIEGDAVDTLFYNEDFVRVSKEHVQFSGQDQRRKTVVLYRLQEGKFKISGPQRVHQVCAVANGGDEREAGRAPILDGTGITFGDGTPPMIASALRRLHQNLGHPQTGDLIRHLRLAGCDTPVLKAARSLRCQVCEASVAPKIARPSVIPQLCDWNDTVGIDLFYAHDANDVKHTFLSAVDYGTTFHLAIRVDGQSSDDIEAKFNEMWIIPFGPPKTVVVDLDGGVQGALGRLCEWHNIGMKSIAAQSHWQAGMIERQQAWWKNIWERLVYQLTVGEDEVDLAVPIVNGAKNELRRRCGHSPSQWVFGRAPRVPEDLRDPDSGENVTWDVTEDSRFQRLSAMRAAARVAFHRSQVDSRLRKAFLQRARTVPRPHEIGESVHFWSKPKNRRRGHWTGPAVIVGREGNNYWISNNGRCRLTSPEHIRGSTPEEVGAYLSMKGTQREVEKLLECDPDGDEAFDEEEEIEEPQDEFEEMDFEHDDAVILEPAIEEDELPIPRRRLKRKTNVAQLDEEQTHDALMLKSDLTRRGVEKRKEKELKWSEIPDDVKEKFREAEQVQWEEHLSYDALQPLTTAESAEVRQRISAERILRCRWAYKDKNWAKRREGDVEAPWRCKSRLVIAGHTDPDLGNEFLSTDAPTLSRSGLACLLQLTANGLRDQDRWGLSAGDIKCAFLTGSYLTRELYMHQPRTGFPGMAPGQLVRIKKNVFGLATSPHEWWGDLQNGFFTVEVRDNSGDVFKFEQCALDPCIFMLRRWDSGEFHGAPVAYVGCHVDDLLVAAPKSYRKKIEEALSGVFPIDTWEQDQFEFLGSQIRVNDETVEMSQEKYAATRLFQLELPPNAKDDDYASAELVSDNRSLIGALSWMSAQSRPDLTCSVSMAQQLQSHPTIGDLRFTNATANKAAQFKDRGLVFHPIAIDRIMLIIFHDAAWANVPAPDPNEDYYVLTPEDDLAGLQNEGPYVNKENDRKAKKGSSKVASQLGVLVTFADRGVLNNEPGSYSIADWKSRAGQRVCRSTFGAETQACAEGLETGQYMRSMLETLINGHLITVVLPVLCLSDCRSLYDHLNKQGIPRVPTDKRLAVDLAALRQALKSEMWGDSLPIGHPNLLANLREFQEAAAEQERARLAASGLLLEERSVYRDEAADTDGELSDLELGPRVKWPARRPYQMKNVHKGSGVPHRKKHRWKH
ncbi:RE1 [Symbiodinium sp. KB8]|nr:RE1 [Symbiodinium sp. KB8]